MDAAWKKVLLNQFHDIIPGSSIRRVHEEAETAYAEVIREANLMATDSMRRLVRQDEDALTVFNSLNWTRRELVELPKNFRGAVDDDGTALEVQDFAEGKLVEVEVPSCGWATLRQSRPSVRQRKGTSVKASRRLLENDQLRLRINAAGQIVSLYDKQAGRELAAGPCNHFRMYRDVPPKYDAWDILSSYEQEEIALNLSADVDVMASGPLVASLRITRMLNNSKMTQDIVLRRGSRRVDFITTIDWRERHKLLKVAFPVDIQADHAVHEIQFGHICRPNHRSRPFDAERFEVCNHKWTALIESNRGCAVLNDCKYGLNVLGKSINLTLLRAPLAPDPIADQGTQRFTYSYFAWNGSFSDSDVVRQAYELNCPVLTISGNGGWRSLFTVDMPNIIIETVKPAEDGSGDVIIRLYESKRMATTCVLTTSLPATAAAQANMLEERQRRLKLSRGRVALAFRPFEIKTIRLVLKAESKK